MYICPNCGKTTQEQVAFCDACGSRLVEQTVQPVAEPTVSAPAYQAPAYQAPAYQPPAYQAPQYQYPAPAYQNVTSVQTGPNKGKIITGMALGIAGFVLAIINILYTLVFMMAEPEVAFVFALVMGIFSMPLSMVGMIMSRGNIEEGSNSGMCSVGKNLGLVGVILSGVALFLGLIALGF